MISNTQLTLPTPNNPSESNLFDVSAAITCFDSCQPRKLGLLLRLHNKELPHKTKHIILRYNEYINCYFGYNEETPCFPLSYPLYRMGFPIDTTYVLVMLETDYNRFV